MAKPPRMTATKVKPMAKPAAKTMNPSAVLGRAERIQKLEAGESRLVRPMATKSKAAPLIMAPADRARTQATLNRAARIQREEAGESMLLKRKPVDVIRTTVRMKETPAKKK